MIIDHLITEELMSTEKLTPVILLIQVFLCQVSRDAETLI
jgi:hypothetical protein